MIYWNAFVPNNGESLTIWCPHPMWRCLTPSPPGVARLGSVAVSDLAQAFVDDAELETAQKAYNILNPHPEKTFSDKISIKTDPADMQIVKSPSTVLKTLRCRIITCASADVAEIGAVPIGADSRQPSFASPIPSGWRSYRGRSRLTGSGGLRQHVLAADAASRHLNKSTTDAFSTII